MNTTIAATALMMTRGLGRRTLADFIERVPPDALADVVRFETSALVDKYGLPPTLAERLSDSLVAAERLEDDFAESGVVAITKRDERYPHRLLDVLGSDAPPVLFVIGNIDLASRSAVGFCGSRKASEKGLKVARDAAAMLAAEGIVLVSGYASGVDLAVHRSSLEAGGTTIFVLAEGILHFRAKRDVAPLLTAENHLVVSEFPPGLPWLARSAMQRNRTIIGLSDAMIVIESGLTGGTYACGEATLECGRPLFVADYAAPADSAEGNQHFLNRGASPLRGNSEGVPNLWRVLQVVKDADSPTAIRQTHPTLFPDDAD